MRHVARRARAGRVMTLQGEDEGHEAGAPRVASTRTIVLGLVLVVIIAVGLVLLLSRAAGYQQVLDALESADGTWLVACFVLEVAAYAGYVVCLRSVIDMDGGPRLSARLSTRVWLASAGATRIVAPAGAGGLALIYWFLRRAGLAARAAAGKVLGFNILLFGLFGAWAFAASLVTLLAVGEEAPLGMTLPWLVIIPLFAFGGVWVSQGARGGRLAADTHRGWLRKGLAAAVTGIIVARRAIRPGQHDARALWGAAVYWAGDVACLWAALQAIGTEVSFQGVAIAYATAYLAMLVPLPTGGYGALDAAATFALTLLGVPLAEALVGVVLWRFFNFWLPTIPALIELARSRDIGRRMHEEAA